MQALHKEFNTVPKFFIVEGASCEDIANNIAADTTMTDFIEKFSKNLQLFATIIASLALITFSCRYLFNQIRKRNSLAGSDLTKYGVDITQKCKEGKLDPVIGRKKELSQVITTLCRRRKANPILTGKAGVGKTALIDALARAIVNGKVPEKLANMRIISLDLTAMLAGTTLRGQFSERMNAVIDEVKQLENIILFIDEIHRLVGAGAANNSNSSSASEILKPALARGGFRCIGATTAEEYHQYIQPDAALDRRFGEVHIKEPTTEEAIQILHGLKKTYETHHNCTYTDEALSAAVELSGRHIKDKCLPDKAIDLLDLTGVDAQIRGEDFVGLSDIRRTISEQQNIPLNQLYPIEISVD